MGKPPAAGIPSPLCYLVYARDYIIPPTVVVITFLGWACKVDCSFSIRSDRAARERRRRRYIRGRKYVFNYLFLSYQGYLMEEKDCHYFLPHAQCTRPFLDA